MLKPRALLRAEGAAVLIAACILYRQMHAGWVRFGLLFLAPDLSMIGYLANKRLGALTYNLAQTYAGPLLVFALFWLLDQASLFWLAWFGSPTSASIGCCGTGSSMRRRSKTHICNAYESRVEAKPANRDRGRRWPRRAPDCDGAIARAQTWRGSRAGAGGGSGLLRCSRCCRRGQFDRSLARIPLLEAWKAHQLVEEGSVARKIVLLCSPP